jgi:hypothetical protein
MADFAFQYTLPTRWLEHRIQDSVLSSRFIMSAKTQKNMKVAMLAADNFEQVELELPLSALKDAGGEVSIVSLRVGRILGMNHMEQGAPITVD